MRPFRTSCNFIIYCLFRLLLHKGSFTSITGSQRVYCVQDNAGKNTSQNRIFLCQDTEIIIIGLTYNFDERKPRHFFE